MKLSECVLWDCETLALPPDKVLEIVGPFDPDSVKCGNLKDPAKIAAKIEECRAIYLSDAVEAAAKSATTGKLCIFGYLTEINGKEVIVQRSLLDCMAVALIDPEAALIDAAWLDMTGDLADRPWIGYNTTRFDIPFLIRRSWILDVPVPPILTDKGYPIDQFQDLRKVWQLGDNQETHGGLEGLCRAFGLPGKTGKGSEFAALWEADKKAALAYHEGDLRAMWPLVQRMLPLPVNKMGKQIRLHEKPETKPDPTVNF